MKKSISIWAFTKPDIAEAVQRAKKAGFEAIELAVAEDADINMNATESDVRKTADMVRSAGLEIASVATGLFWKYSMTSAKKENVEAAKNVCRKMIDVASWLGTDGILVIPGGVGADFIEGYEVVSYDDAYPRALKAVKEVGSYAAKKKISIGLEYVWNKFLLSPLEMKKFIDEARNPYVGAYFDVGNVLRSGYPEQWIRILGKRIKKVHFKDFKRSVGTFDGFVDLTTGDVNWPEVMKAFREVGYNGYATAELFKLDDTGLERTSRAMDAIFKM